MSVWRISTLAAAAVFVIAAAAANLVVAALGIAATPFVAFVLVGADLVTRDALHDAWRGRGLVPRMAALIAAGGLLSAFLNPASGRVALASVLAFVLATSADGITYHLARRQEHARRVTLSNIAGAVVDSLVFVLAAFGAVGTPTWHQATAKIAGGAVWLLLLTRSSPRVWLGVDFGRRSDASAIVLTEEGGRPVILP